MVAADAGQQGAAYACTCLNVRIQSSPSDTAPPESVDDPDYVQVHVGEDIDVKYPELTIRSRKRVAVIPESNRCSRFTAVKCLVCNTQVYRIFQVVSADVDSRDGFVLPSDEYTEKEVLKSPNGWIEVNKDLLTGDAITQAEANPSYSSLFSVIVPPLPSPETPTTNGTRKDPSKGHARSRSPSPEPPSYFSHLKPILLPPPFTPSHPVFLQLAQFAQKESQQRREAAENYVAEIVRQKTAEIEKADAATRRQVEALWRQFRSNLKEASAHTSSSIRSVARRTSRSRERRATRSVSPSYGTPIAVRDFVPVSVPVRRTSSAAPARQSALSASLVTTSFHHPRAQAEADASKEPSSPGSASSKTLSSDSSTLVTQPQPQSLGDAGISVLQFRRNTNETINTEATYRVFLLEEQVLQARKQREAEAALRRAQENQSQVAAATEATSSTTTDPAAKANTSEVHDTPSRGRQGKGKRKVTFDVQPDVATLRQGAQEATQTEETGNAPDMMFPMEDLEPASNKGSEEVASLPLLEQQPVVRPARLGRARPQAMPEELASLRPSSLPAPSHIRPIRSSPGVDSSSTAGMMLSLPQHSNPLARRPPRTNGAKPPLSPTTDQRGTWASFNRGGTSTPTSIPEENEADSNEAVEEAKQTDQSKSIPPPTIPITATKPVVELEGTTDLAGIPRSLPIQIHSRIVRPPLSLASFKPPSAIPENENEQAGEEQAGDKTEPASTIRKAVYAERDRTRFVDPGTTDFKVSEDGDEDEDSDDEEKDEVAELGKDGAPATSRGRKHALKIIEAANKIPDSGMWRSLAN